jgi:hypothetical protein
MRFIKLLDDTTSKTIKKVALLDRIRQMTEDRVCNMEIFWDGMQFQVSGG